MITESIQYVAVFIFVYIISIMSHELGHIVSFKYVTKKTPYVTVRKKRWFPPQMDFVVCNKSDLALLNDNQYKFVIKSGIFVGIVPILLFIPFLPFWMVGCLSLIYFVGCFHDIKLLRGD